MIIPSAYNAPLCDNCCEPKVDIHHDDGDYCLECWSARTEPYITPPPSNMDRVKYWRDKLRTS